MNRPVRIGARLLLHCLGHVRLKDQAGTELTPRTRKARALLAYLSLSGRPATRERLADLLWSDRGPDQARSSVRQALFELRHLAGNETAVAVPARDEVSLNAELVTTDLAEIRKAAKAGNHEHLLALLGDCDAGLLTDLDGLDPEFDSWLHVQRAHEPSQTLGAALSAAGHCLEKGRPQDANAIVAEVQRLDPCNEEAARLAFRIAARTGDGGSLHRHYKLLRERLRTDYDAEPSRETRELFEQLSGDSTPAILPSAAPEATTPAPTAGESRKPDRWVLAVPVIAVLGLVAATVAFRPSPQPATPADLPLLAVLPFEQMPKGDGFLAEGLWDDTRSLLSQGRTVRVLGRTTAEAIADDGLAPRDYRRRLGVAYLLEGSVRRQGDQVRVSVSLTRTADGVSIWEHSFDGRLGDPMALQGAIAQGIEGRIRGRLAPGGGRLASQIATTPQVYSLYSEARTRLRRREAPEIRTASELLRRAIALDPNFAPAHASLAISLSIGTPNPQALATRQAEATSEANRAIALAPNLSEARAALAIAAGFGTPTAEQAIMRAVELDPGNAEAWSWLGNVRMSQFRIKDGTLAYEKAARIDPLWQPANDNLVRNFVLLGDDRAIERIVRRVERADPDGDLAVTMRSTAEIVRGDYSTGVRRLLQFGRASPDGPPMTIRDGLFDGFVRLGYFEEAGKLWSHPWLAAVLEGKALPPKEMDGKRVGPRDFWMSLFFPAFGSRAMLGLGHSKELVDSYRRGFRSRDDFIETLSRFQTAQKVAPNLAVALQQQGDGAEASRLMAEIGAEVDRGLKINPRDRGQMFDLARIRAVQGDREAAIALVSGAVARGWLPDGLFDAIDLDTEPAFYALRTDPRFQAARHRILAHIARERRELGSIDKERLG